MITNSQTLSVACVIPASIDHRTPHTAVVSESFGADGHGLVFVDPRSGPMRFAFDLCIRPTKDAQPQVEGEEESQAIQPVPSSEELYDELCKDAVDYLVLSVVGGNLSPYRSFTLVCSDWESNTSSIACFGQDEDGGLLADILAKLLPYFKVGKKKKKSTEAPADPTMSLRVSIVRGSTLAAVEEVLLQTRNAFDAPLKSPSVLLDETPTTVGEALNVVATARGNGTPGVTVVRLAFKKFGGSSKDFCTLSLVTITSAPQLLRGVAAAIVPSPQLEGWSYPPSLVSVLNVQSAYRSALQEVQQVLKDASVIRGHGPPAGANQSRELKEIGKVLDLSALSNVGRLYDELTAEIRICRLLQRNKGSVVGAPSSSTPKKASTSNEATTGELIEEYRNRRKALEVAADLFDFDALVEERTADARRTKRSRLKAAEEVSKIRQKLDDLAAKTAALVAPRSSKEKQSKKKRKSKKKNNDFDDSEGSSCGDEGPVVDQLTKAEQESIVAEDVDYTMRFEGHAVTESFYSNWKVWTAKQDEVMKTIAGITSVRKKLSHAVKSTSLFSEVVRSASKAAVVAAASKKKNRGTSAVEKEFEALLDRLSTTPSQPGVFSSPNRVRVASQLAEDIIAFTVERAVLISEGVVDGDESYAWFDIEGASRNLKSSAVWDRPLAVTIHEYFPPVSIEVPSGTILGSSDEDSDEVTVMPGKNDTTDLKDTAPEAPPPAPRKDKSSKTKNSAAQEDVQSPTEAQQKGSLTAQSSSSTSATVPQQGSNSASTKKHDTEESDKRYLMAVYDSLTLVQDVTKYLKAGTVMLKHGRNGSPHERLFWIATVGFSMELLWMHSEKKDNRSSISLPEVASISLGPFSKVFKRNPIDHTHQSFFLCFTVTLRDGSRTVDIVAPTLPDFEAWILGLCHIARVDPFWGKPLPLTEMEKQKSALAVECTAAAANLTKEEVALCTSNYIFPSAYLKVKGKVEKIRDEVQLHMRLFANNAEQAFVALGGIHLPQINHKGAILMTKGELRHHCSRFHIDIFRVCEIWKHFSRISLVYDPSFTSATSFGVTHRSK